jgi:hypothetical protein
MATTINASASSGLITTADTSTILQLQTGGTTAVTVDASQNVGIGVTPSAWSGAGWKVLQVGSSAALASQSTAVTRLYNNAYFDGTNLRYVATGYSSQYLQYEDASHRWYTAASGTAGNTISYTQAMTIDSSNNVLVTSAASLGYGTGSGGSVTQATSKSTGVTINKANGRITMNNAALGGGGTAVFLVSNSLVASTDTVVLNVNDPLRGDLYNAWVWYVIGGGFYVALKNIGTISYSDAVVLNFSVIKATTS